MSINKQLWKQLSTQLEIAQNEKPRLAKDISTDNESRTKTLPTIIDELTGNTPKPMFLHVSHNSHGNWHKHWAHGGYLPDEENTEENPVNLKK